MERDIANADNEADRKELIALKQKMDERDRRAKEWKDEPVKYLRWLLKETKYEMKKATNDERREQLYTVQQKILDAIKSYPKKERC